MPEYSCRVTLRTANWEVSFENVARIDFTWFSYCQNTPPPRETQDEDLTLQTLRNLIRQNVWNDGAREDSHDVEW